MTEPDDFAGFDTPEHRAAQSGCHHVVHCAVDADTRPAISADLDNARATTPELVPLYVAALTGPCSLPPAATDTASNPEDTIATEPADRNGLPDGPNMLLDSTTHAGAFGKETDATVEVRAFHNLDGRFDAYEPGHRLREVFTDTMAEQDPLDICDEVWTLLNVGEDPAFGTPDPRAVAYRRRGHRSLSCGDVIAVDRQFYAVTEDGFAHIAGHPPVLSEQQVSDLEYERRTAGGVFVVVHAVADISTNQQWVLKIPRGMWSNGDTDIVWDWVEDHFDRHAQLLGGGTPWGAAPLSAARVAS